MYTDKQTYTGYRTMQLCSDSVKLMAKALYCAERADCYRHVYFNKEKGVFLAADGMSALLVTYGHTDPDALCSDDMSGYQAVDFKELLSSAAGQDCTDNTPLQLDTLVNGYEPDKRYLEGVFSILAVGKHGSKELSEYRLFVDQLSWMIALATHIADHISDMAMGCSDSLKCSKSTHSAVIKISRRGVLVCDIGTEGQYNVRVAISPYVAISPDRLTLEKIRANNPM